eukprot:1154257-Pelagomonas_calceolata.AAC.4
MLQPILPLLLIPSTLVLPEIYRSRVACTYNTDGKCVGMMTPRRFDVLYKASHKAKELGLQSSIFPPPTSFASELLGLLARKTNWRANIRTKRLKTSFH